MTKYQIDLIEKNREYVIKLARLFHSNLPLDDLIAAGNIGLIEAAKRFNPDMNVKFSTFAFRWIRGAISRFISKEYKHVTETFIELTEADLLRKAESVVLVNELLESLTPIEQKILSYRYGLKGESELTYAEIAEKLKISSSKVRRIEEDAKYKLNPKGFEPEISVTLGVDISKEITDLKKTALLNLHQSDLWKSIPEAIEELQKGIKISQSCEYLQKRVRQFLKSDLDTLPGYIKKLMKQWKIYIDNPDPENERKLNLLINSIKKYSTKLKEPPLGSAGTLRRFLRSFEKRYKDFTIEDFEKLAVRKCRYKAQRFVRTEMAKIYNNLYVAGENKSDNVKGYIFHLSDVHKDLSCECERLNNQFITKEEAFNLLPIHPNCLCYLVAEYYTLEEIEKKLVESYKMQSIVEPQAVN